MAATFFSLGALLAALHAMAASVVILVVKYLRRRVERAHVAERHRRARRDVSASFALAASDNVCHVIIDFAHQFRIGVLGSFQFGNESRFRPTQTG